VSRIEERLADAPDTKTSTIFGRSSRRRFRRRDQCLLGVIHGPKAIEVTPFERASYVLDVQEGEGLCVDLRGL
jgi:hypothetical protein